MTFTREMGIMFDVGLRMAKALVWLRRGLVVAFVFCLAGMATAATDLDHWTPRNPLPSGDTLMGVAYGAGRYVAVGALGRLLWSPDSGEWFNGSVGVEQNLQDIAWNGTVFVAVGGNPGESAVFTSPDGNVWTRRTVSAPGPVMRVVWTGTRFAGACYSGSIITSPDGVTWTTAANTGLLLMGLAARGNAVVAYGYGNGVVSTTNGTTWTSVTIPNGTYRIWTGVAASDTAFVLASSTGEIFSSTDGVSWTSRTSHASNLFLTDLIWDGSQFVGSEGGATITSPDGVTWTEHTEKPDGVVMRLCRGPDRYLGVGLDGLIAASDTLDRWYTRSYSATHDNLGSPVYANGQYLVPVTSDTGEKGRILRSPDGLRWTVWHNYTSQNFQRLLWTGSLYVGVGDQGFVATSYPNDVYWTTGSSGTTRTLRALASSGAKLVAVGDEGVVLTSPDGLAWTPQNLGASTYLTEVAWGNSLFVAVGGAGRIYTSPDGETWTLRTSGTTYSMTSVAWSGSKFVALGRDGNSTLALTSSDGVTWVPSSSGSLGTAGLDYARTFLWGDGTFLAVGGDDNPGVMYSGVVYSSTDGVTWTKRVSHGSQLFTGGVWDGSSWLLSGFKGELLASTTAVTAPPRILTHPVSYTSDYLDHTFTVTAEGEDLHYQWYIDDEPVQGGVGASLHIEVPGYEYSVAVYNSAGVVMSRFARLTGTFPEASSIINLSVRAKAGESGSPLIVGFVTRGTGDKTILVRAGGPAIAAAPFNVAGTMPDPTLELHDGATVLSANDNWGDGGLATTLSATFSRVGAYSWLDTASKDAAFEATVNGPRTVFVTPAPSTSPGVVLVEAYDAQVSSTPHLVNVSARNHVGTGADLLIAGFVINGNVPKKVLIRGAGPTLGTEPFNVPGVLADPVLDLHLNDGGVDRVVASNDDWGTEYGAREAAQASGAFAFADGSKDAAILMVLPSGAYTAVVSGAGGTQGEALVEVYEVP